MELPQNFEALVEHANSLQLYNKLIHQLNKDLRFANLDLQFNDNVLPTSLKLILQEEVYNLIQSKFTAYLNLLYIVDVSEAKIKELDVIEVVELSEAVTFLILQRVWQKVWLKTQFS